MYKYFKLGNASLKFKIKLKGATLDLKLTPLTSLILWKELKLISI